MIPADWMPQAKISRVVLHWTAGSHKASDFDRQHYHVLIEGDGKVVKGFPSIAANSLPRVRPGYAAHTRSCNSGSIGVSLCCMANAVERPFNAGKYPLTKSQWAEASSVVAALCKHYGIKVTPETVLSHAEVQGNLGIAQKGKWDIAVLPFDPMTYNTAGKVGDRFRAEVAAKMAGKPAQAAKPAPAPVAPPPAPDPAPAPVPQPPAQKPAPTPAPVAKKKPALLVTIGGAIAAVAIYWWQSITEWVSSIF
jgi:hypothetical protein